MNSIIQVLSILLLLLNLADNASSFTAIQAIATSSRSFSIGTIETHRLPSFSFSSHLKSHAASENVEGPSASSKFYVRNARYMELGKVADIIIDAFYKPSAFLRPYLYLSELSRLQGNYPYEEDVHAFYIACSGVGSSSEEHIVGFVDVDTRPGTKISDAPRPYLSDLAVHGDFRRRGIAKALIKSCEKQAMDWGKNHLHLRVDRQNDGALKMYEDLAYEKQDHSYFGYGRDTTILLKRDFDVGSQSDTCSGGKVDVQTSVAQDHSIEYMI
jgi:ribosomal protein S18 acetylase RimI-like enzyme